MGVLHAYECRMLTCPNVKLQVCPGVDAVELPELASVPLAAHYMWS